MELLINNLKSSNLKVTPQRLSIYNYLCNNKIHPNAEMIYNDIKEDNPTISLATVYKTLKSLRDANLVNEINIGEDSFRYDVNTIPHSHMICKKCNKIIDYYFNKNELELLKKSILNNSNFQVDYQNLYFYGICENCK